MTQHNEPLVLINLFSMPAEGVDQFLADWERNTEHSRTAKGFRGTRLHRSLDPEADYPLVNVARWDSEEDWQEAVSRFFLASHPEHEGEQGPWVSAHPDLYKVVHVIDDPQAEAFPRDTDASGQASR